MKQYMRSLLKGRFGAKAPKFAYRRNRRADEFLSAELLQKAIWSEPDDRKEPAGELFRHFRTVNGAHKWHHYFPVYEQLFGDLQDRPINILEIGVYKGASLELWRRFFHSESVIVGVDIDASCKRFHDPENNIHVRIGSQADAGFLSSLGREFGPFDLVIDDGSHITSHMIATFNALFDSHLAKTDSILSRTRTRTTGPDTGTPVSLSWISPNILWT